MTTLSTSKLAAINVVGLAGLAAKLLDESVLNEWEEKSVLTKEARQDIVSLYGKGALDTYSIWPDIDYEHPKMKPNYEHDCASCFGFGWWIGECIPVQEIEARDGFESDPCPECGEDNSIYAHLHEKKEEEMAADSLPTKVDIDKMLHEFEWELRCAELSDIQGRKE